MRIPKPQYWLPLVTFLWATESLAQTVHISHCSQQCPDVSHPQNEVIVRHLFAAAISQNTGVAEWVAYRVLPDSVGVASLLPRWWQQDQLSSTGASVEQAEDGPGFIQPDLSDAQDREYRVNEISLTSDDRGRLTPMSSFAGTPYWDELNFLSNMSPLPVDLRLGSWSRLDTAINELAETGEDLFVVSGPLYSYQSGTISSENQAPSSYFKVVTDGVSAAAFEFNADLPVHAHHCDQLVDLQFIESKLDRQLFPALGTLDAGDWATQFGCGR